MSQWRILQIIPAQPDWKAVHCQQTEDKKIDVFTRPIICWALVEGAEKDAIRAEVRGIEKDSAVRFRVVDDLLLSNLDDLQLRTEDENPDRDWNMYFLGYDDPGAEPEPDDEDLKGLLSPGEMKRQRWVKQAEDRIEEERERRFRRLNRLKKLQELP